MHFHKKTITLILASFSAFFLLTVVHAAPPPPTNYMVTTLSDIGSGSLRAAITAANDGDTITFDPGISGTITIANSLPALNSVTFSGGENVTLSFSGMSGAFVIADGKTISGKLPGTVEVLYTGIQSANGLTSGGALNINDISGTIAVTAEQGSSHSLFAWDGMELGTISGTIAAKGKSRVYGTRVYSGNLNIHNISNSAKITATANQTRADGLYAYRKIIINDISGQILASARDEAYGIHAYGGVTITNISKSGNISATATGQKAYGIESDNSTVTIGDMAGKISATAGTEAFGIHAANGDITVQNISGDIIAIATENGAIAISAGGALNIQEDISGNITSIADNSIAYGLFGSSSMDINDISGKIRVSTGSGGGVYGVSSGRLTLKDFSGEGLFTSKGNNVLGFLSAGPMTIKNDISGRITAIAEGHTAVGLYSGDVLKGSGSNPALISGEVSAKAKGLAVAVAAEAGMHLKVTGTITAEDTSGNGQAYAIAAGDPMATTNTWTPGGNYDDTVILGTGAKITGKIDLGGGNNTLTLEESGNLTGDVTNITNLDKTGLGNWAVSGKVNADNLSVNQGNLSLSSSTAHNITTGVIQPQGNLTIVVSQTATPSISVSNTLTNNGKMKFQYTPNGLKPVGTAFTVLQGRGLAGTGTYEGTAVWDTKIIGTNIDLVKKAYTDLAITAPSARVLAARLGAMVNGASGDLTEILLQLEASSSLETFNDCLNQLGMVPISGIANLGLGTARLFSSAAQSRMAQMRGIYPNVAKDQGMDPDDPSTWPLVASIGDLSGIMDRTREGTPNGLHFKVLGQSGRVDTHDGFNGYDNSTRGAFGGYDRMLTDRMIAGINLGYADSSIDFLDTGKSRADQENFTGGLYATWFNNGWYVDTTLAGAYSNTDVKRQIPFLGRTASSDTNGHTLGAKAAGGHRFSLGQAWLTPMVSMEYMRQHQDGYTETGAGAANLWVDELDTDSLETGLGFKVDRFVDTRFGKVIPEISLMWMHELLNQDNNLATSMAGMPGVVFSQAVAQPDRDSLALGLGMTAIRESNMAMSVRYQGKFQENSLSHSLSGEFNFLF